MGTNHIQERRPLAEPVRPWARDHRRAVVAEGNVRTSGGSARELHSSGTENPELSRAFVSGWSMPGNESGDRPEGSRELPPTSCLKLGTHRELPLSPADVVETGGATSSPRSAAMAWTRARA